MREDMLDEMEKFKGLIDVYIVVPGKEKLGSKFCFGYYLFILV